MLKKLFMITSVLVVLGACDDTADRLNAQAQICEEAIKIGGLDIAEETCVKALGEPGETEKLDPRVLSDRLFTVAKVKRKLGKFDDAADFLTRSVEVEAGLTPSDSPQTLSRKLELSVILAGQSQWLQGATLLEAMLTKVDKLDDKQKKSLKNITRNYVRQLQEGKHAEQAEKLQRAAEVFDQAQPVPAS